MIELHKSASNPQLYSPMRTPCECIAKERFLNPCAGSPDLTRIFTMFAWLYQTDRLLSTHPGELAAWAASLPGGME